MPIPRPLPAALLTLALLAGCKPAPGTAKSTAPTPPAPPAAAQAAGPAALPTDNAPYAIIARAYMPYTSADPTGFPMKVRNLSNDPYRFWRGSKELFYEWCKTNAADWLKDEAAFLRIHGDLHPGNMGLYHSSGKFGRRVAFGAVDFDDSARLPFQLELLEGVITLKLLAHKQSIKMNEARTDELIAAMVEAYRASLDSSAAPTELLEDDRMVGKMLKDARKRDYEDELDKYVKNDQFVDVVKDNRGRAKELLHSEKGKGAFADAVAEALTHSPDGKDLFKSADFEKKSIQDIARRTQLESAGSEGVRKFLLLVSNKKMSDKRLILYLKEQIPSSAERVGLIPTDPRPAGQRSSEDLSVMSRPPAYFNSWCAWDDGSFRLSIKEPWTETMDGADVLSFEDLKHVGRVWGTVAGSLHRQGDATVAAVKERLTPDLSLKLRELAMVYAKKAAVDFKEFVADPRAREQVGRAEAALRDVESK
jgi:hypothetical protein